VGTADFFVSETGDVASHALLFGARYNPFKDTGNVVMPYLWGGFGSVLLRKHTVHSLVSTDSENPTRSDSEGHQTSITFCLQPGAGVDFFLKRRYVMTVHGAYNVMPAVGVPDMGRWQLNVGFSVLLGKRTGK
jgi:hypothetical protein